MENKKVVIKNMSKSRVVINLPDLRFRCVWEKKNVKRPVDLEVLEQAIYDSGVDYLLRQGILYIEDKDARVYLGLESESEDEEDKIIISLSDDEMTRYLTAMPIFEFKEKLKTLPREQILNLVDFAIEKELTDYAKCEVLKEITNTDIFSAIKLKKDSEG